MRSYRLFVLQAFTCDRQGGESNPVAGVSVHSVFCSKEENARSIRWPAMLVPVLCTPGWVSFRS